MLRVSPFLFVFLFAALFAQSLALSRKRLRYEAWPQPDKLIGFWPLSAEYNVKDIGPNHFDGLSQDQSFTTGPFDLPKTAAVPTSDNTKLLRVNSPEVSIVDSSFTVSLFFKRGGSTASGGIFEFLDKASYTSTKAFQFRYENATTFELSANSVTIGHISMIDQTPGGWTYVAFVFENKDGTLAIYGKNGLVLPQTYKPQLKYSLAFSNNGLRLGYSIRFAQGLSTSDAVACLMVYSTALTSDEVILARDACRKLDEPSLPTTTVNPTTNDPSKLDDLQRQLIKACKVGAVDEVRELLQLGLLDVNWRDGEEEICCWLRVKNGTALLHATHHNPSNISEIVRLLIDFGADVNLKEDINGLTALMFAAHYGQTETIILLLDKGALIDDMDESGWTALMIAAQYGKLDTIELLLDRGAKMEAKDRSGYTPLVWAATSGQLETVRFLLDRKADINTRTKDNSTALKWAAYNGRLETVRLLLDRGAQVNAQDNWGLTSLIWVVASGRSDMGNTLSLLLDREADINVKSNDGLTALMEAARYASTETISLLLDRGAIIDATDYDGSTALMHAASGNGRVEAVRLLLDRGADINARNKYKYTALLAAAERGEIEVVRLLKSRGASLDGCNLPNCNA